MRVNNINGTSDNSCNCGSWLDHWKNYSRQALPTYPVQGEAGGRGRGGRKRAFLKYYKIYLA